ncbi:MAG: zf-HC2 domain-containing protein [Phycisphaerae bacterium]|nr:zf-HC2 domain-containing protein [Phycisphaerae bacterium]
MTCRDYRDWMMAFVDGELDGPQKKAFEDHIAGCRGCAEELAQFQKLKTLTDRAALAEPEDRIWQQYWDGVYNRIERGLGWILFSMAAILLILYGGYKAVEAILRDPGVGLCLKITLLTLVAGVGVLFVSVARERLYFWKRERYKDVRR